MEKPAFKNLIFDKKKGKIKLNERASIFFFCLSLATFFWFLSSLSKDYTTTLSIPLSYTSYNKDFILVDAPQNKVVIQVKGNGFDLLGEQMSLNRKEIAVDLDKAKVISLNKRGFSASILKNEILKKLDKDLSYEQIITDSVYFYTQARLKKKLVVVPELDLRYKSSFNLIGGIIISPAELEVSGPFNRIDTLDVLKTMTISKEDLSDSIVISYDFEEDEAYAGLTIVPSKIELLIPVEKFTEKVFELDVEHNVKDQSIGLRTFPNKVKVVFLVPLSKYSLFTEELLKAKVDLDDEALTKKKLAVKMEGIPSYAKLLRVEPEKVEFIIKE